jgi:dimeric dUTPase (all-alpha-NTP-PPase superfamily)
MNLQKLFEMQRQLDERIEQEHPRQEGEDRLAKKILALQVELGELANEWRGFKFWSKNQEPRIQKREHCPDCMKRGFSRYNSPEDDEYWCKTCAGYLVIDKNPLLEEYVDALHFILSIGLEIEYGTEYNPNHEINVFVSKETYKARNIINQFNSVFELANAMSHDDYYFELFASFIHLGEMLGFTPEEIEEAYMKKNKINHGRQNNNY